MVVSKASFESRPKYRGLSKHEKEARYKQHLMSEGGIRDKSLPARGPRGNMGRTRGKGHFIGDAYRYGKEKFHKYGDMIPKGTFEKLGNLSGMPWGGSAGKLISMMTGKGDYEVMRNSLMKGSAGGAAVPGAMSFSATGAANCRLQKREFIMEVKTPPYTGSGANTSSPFNMDSFRLQCSDGKTFPWIAKISQHFTEWELEGCIFTFESTSSNFAQNSGLGAIAMATQYNSNDTPYTDMEEMLQSAYNTRGNPSQYIEHGIECDEELQESDHLYVRNYGSKGPPFKYDHGVFYIATEGLPSKVGTVLGRLYCHYDIVLKIPCALKQNPTLGQVCVFQGWTPISSTVACGPFGPVFASTGVWPVALNGFTNFFNSAQSMGLNIGTDISSNFLLMPGAAGPATEPYIPAMYESRFLGWWNDGLDMLGAYTNTTYLTIANPGKYIVKMVACGGIFNAIPGVQPGIFVKTSGLDDTTNIADTSIGGVAPNFGTKIGDSVNLSALITLIITTIEPNAVIAFKKVGTNFAEVNVSITVC
jgi:hypothetical protein